MIKLKDKVFIVTGASSGIGEACIRELDRRGAKTVLAARDKARLDLAAKSLTGEYLIYPADISKKEDCRHLIEAALDRFGRIDGLINNAGISMRALFRDLDLEVIEKVMQINFWGTVYCTWYALPHIIKTQGSITGISSIAGFRGIPGR